MTDSTGVRHTPGPWRVEEGTTLVWGHCIPDDTSTRGMGYPIAEARIMPSGTWAKGPWVDEGEANARLIAAAPDLLAAAQAMMARWPVDQHDGSPLKAEADALRAALNRATGDA